MITLALFAGLRHEVGAKPDWEVYHQVFYDAPEHLSNLFAYFANKSILKILGIEETIASTKKKYTEIAVKLASDITFRNSIVNKIKKHKK